MQYIVPIVALFHGRVVDKPEQAMKGTEYSTRGDVEHEIFMIGGVLFFIIKFKFGMPDANALAQLFLELLCAFSYCICILSLEPPASRRCNE